MVKKTKKKAKARNKLTPLQKIKKELGKLEALHAKEEAIVERIDEVIEEAEEENSGWEGYSYGGTNGD